MCLLLDKIWLRKNIFFYVMVLFNGFENIVKGFLMLGFKRILIDYSRKSCGIILGFLIFVYDSVLK